MHAETAEAVGASTGASPSTSPSTSIGADSTLAQRQPFELQAHVALQSQTSNLEIANPPITATALEQSVETALSTDPANHTVAVAGVSAETASSATESSALGSDAAALSSLDTATTSTSRQLAPTHAAIVPSEQPSARALASSDVPQPATDQAPAARAEHAPDPESVLRQFRLNVVPELRQATIQLVPAELGRIWIRINVDEDRLSATVRAERPETLEVLDRHLPELRASLSRQGIEAQQFDLALGFQDRGSNAAGGEPNRRESESSRPRTESVEIARTHIVRSMIADASVDTYA